MRGTPDRTARACGNRLQLAATRLASVDPHTRLYALPGWGILVVGSEENSIVARSEGGHEPARGDPHAPGLALFVGVVGLGDHVDGGRMVGLVIGAAGAGDEGGAARGRAVGHVGDGQRSPADVGEELAELVAAGRPAGDKDAVVGGADGPLQVFEVGPHPVGVGLDEGASHVGQVVGQ